MGWGGARPNSGPKRKSGSNGAAKPAAPPKPEAAKKALVKIGFDALATAKRKPGQKLHPFVRANHPPSVFPKDHRLTLAMDEAINQSLAWSANMILNGMFSEGIGFLGYPYLAELTQRAEYRVISETIATEATREWIKIQATSVSDAPKHPDGETPGASGEKPEPKAAPEPKPGVPPEDEPEAAAAAASKTAKIKELEAEFDRLKVQDVFRRASEQDGFFGRSHIYVDIEGARDDRDELLTSIGNGRNETSIAKIKKGSLKRLQNVEPIWCYPSVYNAVDPLAPGWYNPQMWFCMGKELHQSRLMTFVGREVPDLLKPAYSFGGLSLSQIAKPYVDNWLRTRQSVADIVHAFSVMVLSTDLSESLSAAGDELFKRLDFFNATRDNRGIMAVNKDSEELKNVSAPLSSLDLLQAQTQEHMAAVSKIPIVKLLGIQPAGLNASSEDVIKTFDDTIAAYQEKFFGEALRRVLGFAQLNLWGEIDPEITAVFQPLRQMTEKEKGEIEKSQAEADQIHIDTGVLWPGEVRKTLAANEDSRYSDIDVEDLPELPEETAQTGFEPGAEPGGGPPPDGGGGDPPANDALFDDPDRDTQNWLDSTRWPKNARKVEVTIHLDPRRDEGAGEPGELPISPEGGEPGGEDAVIVPFAEGGRRSPGAADEFNEADHPRGQPGNAGQFGSGGGGKSSTKEPKEKITAPQYGMPFGHFTASGPSAPRPTNIGEPLDVSKLKKVGAQMGSNPGGVYEDGEGKRFYVKQGKSKDHVKNEMIAASLYDLAGAPTLEYRPVNGGTHVATEIEKLDKDNAGKLSDKEKLEAARDFAVHAWLGNWDAVGLGGDNIGAIRGTPVSLDLGGAMEYRAQGSPKGKAFGETVSELTSMRDPKVNKDAAGLFGEMTPAQLRESARYVTAIKDEKIRAAVEKLGGDPKLAEKLIARKNDIGQQARLFGAEGDPAKPTATMVIPTGAPMPIKTLNGVDFDSWEPPEDWATVDGQMAELDEPAFEPGKMRAASGVVVREPDGRVWIIQPRGGYGGYEGTFPKGGAEEGLSLQANAIKEAYEESGLKVRITGFLGDHPGDSTMTRYYHAVREGGDPSKHDDESEGVVLAPESKVEGFLSRGRDRKVLASDAAAFEESKHPRDSDGQFATSSGGGSEGEGAASYEDFAKKADEMVEGGFAHGLIDLVKGNPEWADQLAKKDPQMAGEIAVAKEVIAKEKAANEEGPAITKQAVLSMLSKPAIAGGNYRRGLVKAIKWAHEQGDKSTAAGLTGKLIESWQKTYANAAKKGDHDKAVAIAKKIAKLGGSPPAASTLPPKGSKPAPTPSPAEQNTELNKNMVAATSAKPAPSKATPQELEKAKKTVALQLQYVPGGGDLQFEKTKGEAQKLVNAFNAKYADKAPDSLEQKVADFKELGAKVAALKAVESQQAATLQKQQAEAAKAKAVEMKAKQDAEAKAAAAKNAEVMKELGITELEAYGFNALAEMIGGSTKNLVENFKGYEKKASQYGYPISGFQAALIANYSNGGYQSVNKQLRKGVWSESTHVYVKMVNKALAKMPAYTGLVNRGCSTMPEAELAKYQVGMIKEESAFTSTSTGGGFGGDVRFKITAIGQRGASIQKLSNHHGESEVLFQARTFFKVTKIEKKDGETHIHMTEMPE